MPSNDKKIDIKMVNQLDVLNVNKGNRNKIPINRFQQIDMKAQSCQ